MVGEQVWCANEKGDALYGYEYDKKYSRVSETIVYESCFETEESKYAMSKKKRGVFRNKKKWKRREIV
jgi:hypothetical protein